MDVCLTFQIEPNFVLFLGFEGGVCKMGIGYYSMLFITHISTIG